MPNNTNLTITGRVVEAKSQNSIGGAKVSLATQLFPEVQYTDSEGNFGFTVAISRSNMPARLSVEKTGFRTYERNIILNENTPFQDVRLDRTGQTGAGASNRTWLKFTIKVAVPLLVALIGAAGIWQYIVAPIVVPRMTPTPFATGTPATTATATLPVTPSPTSSVTPLVVGCAVPEGKSIFLDGIYYTLSPKVTRRDTDFQFTLSLTNCRPGAIRFHWNNGPSWVYVFDDQGQSYLPVGEDSYSGCNLGDHEKDIRSKETLVIGYADEKGNPNYCFGRYRGGITVNAKTLTVHARKRLDMPDLTWTYDLATESTYP